MRHQASILVVFAALILTPVLPRAQQATPATPPGTPAVPATPSPPPAPPAAAAPEATPGSDAPAAAADVVLAESPALVLHGEATWDEGFDALSKAFATLEAEAAKAGLTVAGKPRAHFVKTDDFGFQFAAMLPLSAAPAGVPTFAAGVAAGATPAGKAMRFPFSGAYDDIDSAYEAITAYLDEKGITAKGSFVEEYMVLPKTSSDATLELNIYVFVE